MPQRVLISLRVQSLRARSARNRLPMVGCCWVMRIRCSCRGGAGSRWFPPHLGGVSRYSLVAILDHHDQSGLTIFRSGSLFSITVMARQAPDDHRHRRGEREKMQLFKRGQLFTALLALGLVAATAAAQEPATNVPPVMQAPATSAAPPPADAMPGPTDRLTAPDLEAWLDGFMPYALEQTDVAGSVVVVVKDGKILLEKGYGFSDLEKRAPVDPEKTLFRPGSISKLFTWTAVMQLVEEGKLNLDEDVNKYLDFTIPPYDGKPVTLRNIMTHTSGMEEAVRGLIAEKESAIVPLDATLKHWVPARV